MVSASGKRVDNVYVTSERLSEWKSSNNPKKWSIPVDPSRFVYELCWAIIRGDLSYSKCRIALESVDLLGNHSTITFDDISNTLADVIAHIVQEIPSPSESRSKLIELSKWLTNTQLIPAKLLQERCEEEFLYEAGMIKMDANEFKKKIVRINTRLIYTQTKFNLLREESEGYAKLCTILNQTGSDELNNASSAYVVDSIKSLIGYFDLDPNRVFDIILDSFEMQPNNESFFDLIPLFPKTHLAHILGFKFQNYLTIENFEEKIPKSLYIITAKLLKNNFFSLDAIYPHLASDDNEEIEKFEIEKEKRLKEVSKIGQINLAATGSDLVSEEVQAIESQIDFFSCIDGEENFVKLRTGDLKKNLKINLLVHMLEEGDWENSKILFLRLSKVNPISYHPISNALFKLMHKCVDKYFKASQPKFLQKNISPSLENYSFFSAPFAGSKEPYFDYSANEVSEPSKIEISAVDKDKTEIISPNSALMKISKQRQEKLLCSELLEMLKILGPYLYRDIVLLQKFCRILKFEAIKADKNDLEKIQIQNYIASVMEFSFLPSLRLIIANPPVCIQIWQLLEYIPFEIRYRLYGEWESEKEKMPMLIAAKQISKLDTRRVLKRLAKENLKPTGRVLAKLAHSNPMIVLRTIVVQIEAYKEMINPVVESFKYFNQLEFDILEYVVIERLSLHRKKIKEDGLNISDWLQCLASFWGTVCKKYPSMELKGLFQYVFNQLMQNEGTDLILLQELIQQMSCIEFEENLNDEQIASLSGGEILKQNFFSFGQLRNNKALSKSISRLRDALLPKEERKLAFPLLVLIAHQRTNSIFTGENSLPIKIVSQKFDRFHSILVQYVDFLYNSITPVQYYAQIIPNLRDLVQTYNINPEIAFHIYRPIFRLFKSKSSGLYWPLEALNSENNDNSTKSDGIKLVNSEGGHGNNSADKDCDSFAEMPQIHSNSDLDDDSNLVLDVGNSNKPPITWNNLLESVKTFFPTKVWNGISPKFYTLFWSLSLSDLQFPSITYEKEINKLKLQMKALEESEENSVQAIQKRKKEKDRITDIIEKLNLESSKQNNIVASVNQKLKKEKNSYLSLCSPWQIMPKFLQFCLIPRCLLSIQDAVYCVRFIEKLHEIETPNFSTVQGIDMFVCRVLLPLLCSCTENEAGRLGIFLLELLTMIHKWKNDETLYNQCCLNKPGFLSGFNKNSSSMTYQDFRKVNWKWNGLLLKIVVSCLESTEYIEIRNVLTLLSKIFTVFPTNRNGGIRVEKKVLKLKNEERQDLKLLATSVSASLASRKNFWVSDDEFGGSPPSIPKTIGSSTLSKSEASKKIASDHLASSKTKLTLSPSTPLTPKPTPSDKIPADQTSQSATTHTLIQAETNVEKISQTVKLSQVKIGSVERNVKPTSVSTPTHPSVSLSVDSVKNTRSHAEVKESLDLRTTGPGLTDAKVEVRSNEPKVRLTKEEKINTDGLTETFVEEKSNSSSSKRDEKVSTLKESVHESQRRRFEMEEVIEELKLSREKSSGRVINLGGEGERDGEAEKKIQEKILSRTRAGLMGREKILSTEEKEESGEKEREKGGYSFKEKDDDRERERDKERDRGREKERGREREKDTVFRHGGREEGMRVDHFKDAKLDKHAFTSHDEHSSHVPHSPHPHSQFSSIQKGEGKRALEEGEEKGELSSERFGKRIRKGEGYGDVGTIESEGTRVDDRLYREVESRRDGKGRLEENEKEREEKDKERGRERDKEKEKEKERERDKDRDRRETKERSLSRESKSDSKEREKERDKDRESKSRSERIGIEGRREGDRTEKGRRDTEEKTEKETDESQKDWKEKEAEGFKGERGFKESLGMERDKDRKAKGDTEEKDERAFKQEDGLKKGDKEFSKSEIYFVHKKMHDGGEKVGAREEENVKEGRIKYKDEVGFLSFSEERLGKDHPSLFSTSVASKREERDEREDEKRKKREEEKRTMRPFVSVKSSPPSPSPSPFLKLSEERIGEGRRMMNDLSSSGEDGLLRKKRTIDEEIKEKIKREREEKEEREREMERDRDREREWEREKEREIVLSRREWGDRDKTDKAKSILTSKDEMVSDTQFKRRKLRREGILEPSPSSYTVPLPLPPPPPSHNLSPSRPHLVGYEPRGEEGRRKILPELGVARNRITYEDNYMGNRVMNNSRFYNKGVRGMRGEETMYEMEDVDDGRGRIRGGSGDRKRHGDGRRH